MAAVVGLGDPWLTWAWMAAALVGATFGAWLLLGFAVRFTTRTDGDVDDRFARALHRPLALFLGLVTAGAVLARFGAGLTQKQMDGSQHTLAALALVTAAWTVVAVTRLLLEYTGKRRARLLPATRVMRRLLAVVIYTSAFLMVLQQYGIAITPLLTGLGIAGLAAALALQDTLSNFFAGISIQTGRAMQPGHFVRLERDKLEGYVAEVGWRTTWIRTLGGNLIVIPNSTLAQAVVTDFYLPSPDLAVSLDVVVRKDSDPVKVITVLVDEASAAMQGNDGYVAGSVPHATLASIEDSGLRFSLSVRVNEFVQQYAVLNELRLRAVMRLRREGIQLAVPMQEAVKPPERHGVERPPRPKAGAEAAIAELAPDPREAEAAKAREEIAAKQAAKEREAEEKETPKDERDDKPKEPPKEAAAAISSPPASTEG